MGRLECVRIGCWGEACGLFYFRDLRLTGAAYCPRCAVEMLPWFSTLENWLWLDEEAYRDEQTLVAFGRIGQ